MLKNTYYTSTIYHMSWLHVLANLSHGLKLSELLLSDSVAICLLFTIYQTILCFKQHLLVHTPQGGMPPNFTEMNL